jgi:hypothetical protein
VVCAILAFSLPNSIDVAERLDCAFDALLPALSHRCAITDAAVGEVGNNDEGSCWDEEIQSLQVSSLLRLNRVSFSGKCPDPVIKAYDHRRKKISAQQTNKLLIL